MGQASLLRQWVILQTLSHRRLGVTVAELAEEAEVNEKTVRRDLAMFRRLGFPLEELVGAHGVKSWRIHDGHGNLSCGFSFDEALALYVAGQFLEPMAGTLLWQAAQNAFRKVRASFGHTALAYVEKLASSVHATRVGAGDYARKGEALDALLRGIEERKTVLIEYQSLRATEPVTYEICPYAVVFHEHSLYLVAESRDHGEVRHFKLDRLSSAEVSPFPFHRPDSFDVRQHLSDSFGVFKSGQQDLMLVRIKFAASASRFVLESRWHDSQKLTKRRDGSVLAEFQLSNTEEIKRWVLSFGAAAEVIEPATLREEIRRELEHQIEVYRPAAQTQRGSRKSPK